MLPGNRPGTRRVLTDHTQAAGSKALHSICTEVLARLAPQAPRRFARRPDCGNLPADSPGRSPRATPRPRQRSSVYSTPGCQGSGTRGPGLCVQPRQGRHGLGAAHTPTVAGRKHVGRVGDRAGLVAEQAPAHGQVPAHARRHKPPHDASPGTVAAVPRAHPSMPPRPASRIDRPQCDRVSHPVPACALAWPQTTRWSRNRDRKTDPVLDPKSGPKTRCTKRAPQYWGGPVCAPDFGPALWAPFWGRPWDPGLGGLPSPSMVH